MKTKAIIFDKDGTLIDFDAFWVTITRAALADLLRAVGREDLPADGILAALGHADGVTDITSVFCYGTFGQVGEVIHRSLAAGGRVPELDAFVQMTIDAFHRNTDKGVIAPACDGIPALLDKLRGLGLELAVATTDDPFTTGKCLRALDIEDRFALVYTDDGVCPAKPDPFCIRDLCAKLSLTPDQVVMVGDTINDMRFARNGGIRAIGVAKDAKNRAVLAAHADAVIPDISHILEVIE